MATQKTVADVIFEQADTDHDGSLSCRELHCLLSDFGWEEQRIEAFLTAADQDRDGRLSKDEFKRWQPDWAAAATAAALPAAKPAQGKFHAFLSHNWGKDAAGRDNHARVLAVNSKLCEAGMAAWFDVEQMEGDVNDKMAEGVDDSRCMVVFVTANYIQKASGRGPRGADDNCKFEFDYALRRQGVARMVVAVMEPGCRDTSQWVGSVGGKLGGKLYVDLSSDVGSEQFDKAVEQLQREIISVAGTRLEAEGGGVYQGDVKDGSSTMHGTGTYWYPGGDVYSGQWQDDECCGVGEYVYADGGVDAGHWRAGQLHGAGCRASTADGERYEGCFIDGEKHGQGRLAFADGAVYEGGWCKGMMQGAGACLGAGGGP